MLRDHEVTLDLSAWLPHVTQQSLGRSVKEPVHKLLHGLFAHRIAANLWTVNVGTAGLAARDATALLQTVEQRHDRRVREDTLLGYGFSNVVHRTLAEM